MDSPNVETKSHYEVHRCAAGVQQGKQYKGGTLTDSFRSGSTSKATKAEAKITTLAEQRDHPTEELRWRRKQSAAGMWENLDQYGLAKPTERPL